MNCRVWLSNGRPDKDDGCARTNRARHGNTPLPELPSTRVNDVFINRPGRRQVFGEPPFCLKSWSASDFTDEEWQSKADRSPLIFSSGCDDMSRYSACRVELWIVPGEVEKLNRPLATFRAGGQ